MKVLPRLCLLLCSAPLAAQSMCARLAALASDPSVAAAHWGVAVESLDGTLLCGLHEAQLFRPASNAKLFTATAALALLGPERRFETQVIAEGTLVDGVLTGDLVLRGGGDPSFGTTDVPYRPASAVHTATPASSHDLDVLAEQLHAQGLRRVDGSILGDDRQFAWEPYPPNWSLDDLTFGYAAPVSALDLHDNAVEVQVAAPSPASASPAITLEPGVPYFNIVDSRSPTASADCGAHFGVRRTPDPPTLVVFGSAAPCRASVAVYDPAAFAAIAFKEALLARGIEVSGDARARHADPLRTGPVLRAEAEQSTVALQLARGELPVPGQGATNCAAQATETGSILPGSTVSDKAVLARHPSPTLADDLTYTLKESDNLHAEVTLRNLGATLSCAHTQSESVAILRAFLKYAGVAAGDVALYDGSGLSDHDLATPRALAQVLVYAAGQPWFPQFKAMLPLGGVDGTLASRFTGPLKGKVFAKTGTLGESRALSGYLTTASGKTLVFSILVDNHLPGTTADRAQMDKMVEAIAAAN